jgi:hypothetical protein
MNLLITIPGIGGDNFDLKQNILKDNIDKISKTFGGKVDVLIFNYSFDDFEAYFNDFDIIKKSGIVGEYLYKYVNPNKIEYDFYLIMLDDIILSENFNTDYFVDLYNKYNLDIITPSLTKDSKFSHKFMLENDEFKGKLRIVNFCECFFYLMNRESYIKYHKILDEKTYWLWGIDLCLDKLGFKMGLHNDYKIKHLYKGVSYSNNLPNPYVEMKDKESKYGKISDKINIKIVNI